MKERLIDMGMLKTGGHCPKCNGNLYLDRDFNGWYEQCLQCGYMRDLAVVYQKRVRKETAAGAMPEGRSGIDNQRPSKEK